MATGGGDAGTEMTMEERYNAFIDMKRRRRRRRRTTTTTTKRGGWEKKREMGVHVPDWKEYTRSVAVVDGQPCGGSSSNTRVSSRGRRRYFAEHSTYIYTNVYGSNLYWGDRDIALHAMPPLTHVINLASRTGVTIPSEARVPGVKYLDLSMLDNKMQRAPENESSPVDAPEKCWVMNADQARVAIFRLKEAMDMPGSHVLVNCQAGINRSGCVILAHLLTEDPDFREQTDHRLCLNFIKTKRRKNSTVSDMPLNNKTMVSLAIVLANEIRLKQEQRNHGVFLFSLLFLASVLMKKGNRWKILMAAITTLAKVARLYYSKRDSSGANLLMQRLDDTPNVSPMPQRFTSKVALEKAAQRDAAFKAIWGDDY